jgi:Immunoglobulin domain
MRKRFRGTCSCLPLGIGLFFVSLLVNGCGGAGGGNNAVGNPLPTVSVSANPATITLGQATTLTWSGTNATSCTASGDWSGTLAASGSQSVTPATTGTKTYGLSCTGAGGSASGSATVTVNPPPVAPIITTQPASQAVTVGQTATFTVVATGTSPLNYQWQKDGTAIAGATSASYITPVTTLADSGTQFTVTVNNSVGNVTSSPAVLTVTNPVPQISATAPQVVRAGRAGEWTLTVVGTGFISDSIVHVNGGSRTTAFVSDTKLTASMPAIDDATPGQLAITVVSPAPGGGTSNMATVTVDTTVSVAKVATFTLSDPDPSHLFGAKVKALGNFFADGKNAVAVSANNGVYVVRDPDSHPGNFTVSQVGSAALPGVKFFYGGPAIAGTPFYNIGGAGGDFDHDGIKDFIISVNVATPDPINLPGAGIVFIVKGSPELGNHAQIDLYHPPAGVKILRIPGTAPYEFVGSSMADGGDITGDGIDDMAFSALYGYDPAYNTGPGAVVAIYGKTNLFDLFSNQTVVLTQVIGGQVDGRFITRNSPISLASNLGSSGPGSDTLAVGGDKNGDGILDLFIGDMSAQNQSPNTEKTYVVFGDPSARGLSYIEDIGVLFGGMTFQSDHTGCRLNSGNPCFSAFGGRAISGRDGSIMIGSDADWIAGQTVAGSVFISEQPVTNGQIIDVRTAAQALQATSLWSMDAVPLGVGSAIVDGADTRLLGAPNFDTRRGELLFVPSSLPGGNLDVASVISFMITGEQQGDFFSRALARSEDGSILVGAPGSPNGNPGKFYYFSASPDSSTSPNLLF